MKAPKSMAGILRDITRNRADAARARMEYGVYRLLKSGKLSAKPSAELVSEAEANRKAEDLAEMNPGSSWVVRSCKRG